MKISDMELLIEIVERGNFSGVAKKRNVSTNAVIKKMNKIEERIQLQLLERSTHGVQPTKAGQYVYEETKRIIAEMNEIWIRAKEIEQKETGVIRVGTSIMRPCNEILELWNQVEEKEQIQLSVIPFEDKAETFDDIINNLGRDIDVIAMVYDSNRIQNRCQTMKLREEAFGVIVPSNHKLAGLEEIFIEELAKEKLIMVYKGGNKVQDQIRRAIKKLNPNVDIMEVPHYDAETMNLCQTLNRPIIATQRMQINTMLPFVSVRWEFQNSFGLIYAKDANREVKAFVEKIKRKVSG
ncbi:MAG: LysR family transcriptional regulator [Eubacterium sp.]|nr:LysR family transcriptional regulator [Eubacterium sp.]